MNQLLSPFLLEEQWEEDGSRKKDATQKNGGDEASLSKENSEGCGDAAKQKPVGMDADAVERRTCWDAARLHIVEVLSFAVQFHSHRIKYYIMRHSVLQRVMKLVRHRNKNLALAALRFLRCFCVFGVLVCVRVRVFVCLSVGSSTEIVQHIVLQRFNECVLHRDKI